MTARSFVPYDEAARKRIRESLDETLFVEAGAGTGKTTSLVDRVTRLLSSGKTTLNRIAAITFTEAAAAELKDRIRENLERAAADPSLSPEEAARCRQGAADLDRSSIQTLHSFAANLLRIRPLEAGLPPAFDILDPIAADLAFEEMWAGWLDSALDDPELAPPLSLAFSLGLSPRHLRSVAATFHAEHDQLANVTFDEIAPPDASVVASLLEGVSELERFLGYSRLGVSDELYAHVYGQLTVVNRLVELELASPGVYRMLQRILPIKCQRGRQGDWDKDPITGANACAHLKGRLTDLDNQANALLNQARQSVIAPLLRALQQLILEYVAKKKRQGQAEYHDLLVWARDLLRDNLEVRDHFRERYTHLLIDEAQDTDPIQAEIAMFLAEEVAASPLDQGRSRDWTSIKPAVGKLFVVGDPKQSIYRFRRADVRQMLRLQKQLGGDTVRLVQNFRSQKPTLAWVNQVFQQWMQEGASQTQTEYVAVVHRWEAATDHPGKPKVWRLGGPLEETNIGAARYQECRAIASLLQTISRDAWQALDTDATRASGEERYRPATLADICVLMPQRTALRTLELALEDAEVPYRLEGASLIFATQEIRDLINCLRSIDDPTNQVALVATLRSPAFACSDQELLNFAQSGGRFNYLDKTALETNPLLPTGPVVDALRVLRRYHHDRLWASLALLIDRFIREQLLMEAALDHPRAREQWRRYRFMVEQARAFVAVGGNSLRAFLDWIERQAEGGARVTETPVPEGDEDAVRIMTIHAAKGLEFPIVILTGINSTPANRREDVLFDREKSRIEVNIGSGDRRFTTSGYTILADAEQQMGEEEYARLLYVAATRARDHLVVSMFRTAKDDKSASARIAKYLEGQDSLWEPVPEPVTLAMTPPIPAQNDREPPGHLFEDRERWIRQRRQTLQSQGRPASVEATRLARINKEEAVTEEPWRRGRGGSSLGRAVHAVLQTIDLATGVDIEATARAQAAAEAIPQREAEIAQLARVAFESDMVRRAVASPKFWREVPVAIPLVDGVLEGFIDLIFEEDNHLVIVEYKTDVLDREEDLERAAERCRLQIGAYALAAQQAVGRAVGEAALLYLRPPREERYLDVAKLAQEAYNASAAVLLGTFEHQPDMPLP